MPLAKIHVAEGRYDEGRIAEVRAGVREVRRRPLVEADQLVQIRRAETTTAAFRCLAQALETGPRRLVHGDEPVDIHSRYGTAGDRC